MNVEPNGVSKFFSNFFGMKEEKKETKEDLSNVIKKTQGNPPKSLENKEVSQKTSSPIAARTQVLTQPLHNYGNGNDIVCECSQGRTTEIRNALGITNPDKDSKGSHACAVICFHAMQCFMEKGLPKNVKEIYEVIDQGVNIYTQKGYHGDLFFDDVLTVLAKELPEQLEDFVPQIEGMDSVGLGFISGGVDAHMDPVFAALQEKAKQTDGKTCGVLTAGGETLVIMFDENQKPALFNSHGASYGGQELGASLRKFEDMQGLANYIKAKVFKNKDGAFDLKILSKKTIEIKNPALPKELSNEVDQLFHDCFANGIEDLVNHFARDSFLNQIVKNQGNVKESLIKLKTLLNGRQLDNSFRSKPELLIKLCMNTLNENPDLFKVSQKIKDLLKGSLKEGDIEAILPQGFMQRSSVLRNIQKDEEKFSANLEKFHKRLEGNKLITSDLDQHKKGVFLVRIVNDQGESIKLYPTKDGLSLINPNYVPSTPSTKIESPEAKPRGELSSKLFHLMGIDLRDPIFKSIKAKNPSLAQYEMMLKKIRQFKAGNQPYPMEEGDRMVFITEFEKVLWSPTNANDLRDWLVSNKWEMPTYLVKSRKLLEQVSPEIKQLFNENFEHGLESVLPENYYFRSTILDSIVEKQEVFAKNLKVWSEGLKGKKFKAQDLNDEKKVELLSKILRGEVK